MEAIAPALSFFLYAVGAYFVVSVGIVILALLLAAAVARFSR